jgi:DeoR/GlpR family transcriptional regulator of sugar metabolism
LQDDFNIIATEFGRGLSIVRKGGVLKQAKVWESSFSKRGYVISNPDDPNELEDLKAKRRIADFVLADLLAGKSDEVIYLSTGTTVFQVALALVRSEMRGVSYIETDNAAVFELLCHESVDAAWTRHVGIRVLGGGVDLDHGDILGHVLHESPVDQFGKPRCSIAIIGVKAINRDTGELYSFRQSAAKAWVLNDLKQCEAIVPVTPDKIGSARGDPIYQPNLQGYGQRGKAPERRPIHIVTTQINQKDNEALKRHGYTVHEVLPPLRDAV